MMVVLFYAVHLALNYVLSPCSEAKPLAIAIEKQYRSGDLIVVNGAYSLASSVGFLHRAQCTCSTDEWTTVVWLTLSDSPPVFEDDASFAKLWLWAWQDFFLYNECQGSRKAEKVCRRLI